MKKFIFVTGPSESGKSGGINYIIDNYGDTFKHLKIRNIFPEVYKDSHSELDFQTWYNEEYQNNFENLWDRYIKKADEMSGDFDVVIMDTMYGLKTIKYLYEKLGDSLGVLYIDADYQLRVKREFDRLRTDSPRGTRKADLTITIEDVKNRTLTKDRSKSLKETFEYRDLVYYGDSIIVGDRNKEVPFSYLINNNGTIEDFHNALDCFATTQLSLLRNNSNERIRKKANNS